MAGRYVALHRLLSRHARTIVADQGHVSHIKALQHAVGHLRHASGVAGEEPSSSSSGSSSWMPAWLRNRLPGFAGGDQDAAQLADLDLDTYASHLKRARQMGALAGFASGSTRAGDAGAQGGLRMQESIIGAMTPAERADVSVFGPNERRRVAGNVSCTVAQVDDCIAKYMWVKHMTAKAGELKRAGQPMPKTVAEVEQTMGSWRDFRERTQNFDMQAPPGSIVVPGDTLERKSKQPCPLAGKSASRNTKCSLTSRRFKQCCGKS